MSFLFTLALLAIAVYVLYSAITMKGRLFATENIIEEKIPQFKKLLRGIYFGLGVIMLLMAANSGFQNLLYSEGAYRYSEDFKTFYADEITESGKLKGTDFTVNGVYSVSEMRNTLAYVQNQLPLPEDKSFEWAVPVQDEAGRDLYYGYGESELNQNETFAKLRGTLTYRTIQISNYVFMGLAIVVIVGLFVMMNKFTDKEKAAKARSVQSGNAMPSSAFEFDEEKKD